LPNHDDWKTPLGAQTTVREEHSSPRRTTVRSADVDALQARYFVGAVRKLDGYSEEPSAYPFTSRTKALNVSTLCLLLEKLG
jgi:hypothetical protein